MPGGYQYVFGIHTTNAASVTDRHKQPRILPHPDPAISPKTVLDCLRDRSLNSKTMINSLKNLTLGQLKKAVEIKERIESLERELNELVGAPTPARTAPSPVRAANGQPRGKARWSAAKK